MKKSKTIIREIIPSKERLQELSENFIGELRLAEAGEQSSLHFLRHPIPDSSIHTKLSNCKGINNLSSDIPLRKGGKFLKQSEDFNNAEIQEQKQSKHTTSKKKFQVMAIGGSLYHGGIACLVPQTNSIMHVTHGRVDVTREVKVHYNDRADLPKFSSAESLVDFVSKALQPKIGCVILNFAYPLKPFMRNGKLDAKLIRPTKEHTFDGLTGVCIGEYLESELKNRYNIDLQVIVANDIVCLSLAGMHIQGRTLDDLAGGVVGTGVNFGFTINDCDQLQVINIESGGFSNFTQTKSGKYVDAYSERPGEQIFEKEVSGAYLYRHFNYYTSRFDLDEVGSTVEMNDFARDGKGVVQEVANALLKKSAYFIAAQIAAIYKYKQNNNFRLGELEFVMEGSLFWKGLNYQDYVYDGLAQLGISSDDVSFSRVRRSYLLGAVPLVDFEKCLR